MLPKVMLLSVTVTKSNIAFGNTCDYSVTFGKLPKVMLLLVTSVIKSNITIGNMWPKVILHQ